MERQIQKFQHTEQSRIWFTADTHAFHTNLAKGVTEWTFSDLRDFKDEYVMTNHLASQINHYVRPEDTLFHLGDFAMKTALIRFKEFREMLVCKTVHLIRGNHDMERWRDELSENFTSVSDLLEISVNRQRITLCHFPLEIWNKAHKGTWMLHGHCHGSKADSGDGKKLYMKMDVGVDAMFKKFGEYRPISFDEISRLFKDRTVPKLDHH